MAVYRVKLIELEAQEHKFDAIYRWHLHSRLCWGRMSGAAWLMQGRGVLHMRRPHGVRWSRWWIASDLCLLFEGRLHHSYSQEKRGFLITMDLHGILVEVYLNWHASKLALFFSKRIERNIIYSMPLSKFSADILEPISYFLKNYFTSIYPQKKIYIYISKIFISSHMHL